MCLRGIGSKCDFLAHATSGIMNIAALHCRHCVLIGRVRVYCSTHACSAVRHAVAVCRKEVSSITVHPSGRLALSTSRDSSLRLWNLVKGKCAHTTALPSESDQVAFSPAGDAYSLNLGNEASLCFPIYRPPHNNCMREPFTATRNAPTAAQYNKGGVMRTVRRERDIAVCYIRARIMQQQRQKCA